MWLGNVDAKLGCTVVSIVPVTYMLYELQLNNFVQVIVDLYASAMPISSK